MTPTLDSFEQSLLTEMRRHVAGRRAPRRAPHRRRRLAALGATTAAAASIATGAVLLRPDAAFAVTERADGDIVVTISSLEDAAGLRRALAEHGVEAEVSYDADMPAPAAGPEMDAAEAAAEKSITSGDASGVIESETGGAGVEARDEDGAPIAPPELDDLPCGAIVIEMDDKGITFRLPAEAVAAKSPLRIFTAGDEDSWASIGVQWDEPVC